MINAKWLSDDEWAFYSGASEHDDILAIQIVESLAACRELMEKHEWEGAVFEPGGYLRGCSECKKMAHRKGGHAHDCAWAKHIDGFPRKVEEYCRNCKTTDNVSYDIDNEAVLCADCKKEIVEHPECTCYEPEFGHQMGCAYYGKNVVKNRVDAPPQSEEGGK